MKELLGGVQPWARSEGIQDTPVPGLKIIRTSTASERIHSVFTPCLCVILQGSKNVTLADTTLSYRPGEFIVATVELPVTGEVTEASAKKPYLCLMLELDPLVVFDILKALPETPPAAGKRGIFVGSVTAPMQNALGRLVGCLENSRDRAVLAPMIMREIIYWLLSGKEGAAIRQLGIVGSHTQRIARAIEILKRDFKRAVSIEKLAKAVGMSPASFHRYFKEITAMSPLQFQKLLRLQEARRLLAAGKEDAATVALLVGYESPSQFSREYGRLFGMPPKAHARSAALAE